MERVRLSLCRNFTIGSKLRERTHRNGILMDQHSAVVTHERMNAAICHSATLHSFPYVFCPTRDPEPEARVRLVQMIFIA
jgi:hypothetical protein